MSKSAASSSKGSVEAGNETPKASPKWWSLTSAMQRLTQFTRKSSDAEVEKHDTDGAIVDQHEPDVSHLSQPTHSPEGSYSPSLKRSSEPKLVVKHTFLELVLPEGENGADEDLELAGWAEKRRERAYTDSSILYGKDNPARSREAESREATIWSTDPELHASETESVCENFASQATCSTTIDRCATVNMGATRARHLRVVVLSITSSTDNFVVGLSLGVAGYDLPIVLNLVVAFANAFGGAVSTGFGSLMGKGAPSIAGVSAATIFLYLAWGELTTWQSGDESSSPLSKLAASGAAFELALPMTLNNVAGGTAGGLDGIGPLEAGFGALVASFMAMLSGYKVGRSCGGDPAVGSLMAALLFISLAMSSAWSVAQEICKMVRNHRRQAGVAAGVDWWATLALLSSWRNKSKKQKEGDYVLSFDWDCEQTLRILANCADVSTPPPAPVVV